MSFRIANIAKISEGMTNSKELLEEIARQLTLHEEEGEKQAIAFLLFEKASGLGYADVQLNKINTRLDAEWLQCAIQRVNNSEPVQYVTGEAHFLGRVLKVNPSVLIPRPETEELVVWLVNYLKRKRLETPSVIDVGTGSGCIAISLALNLPGIKVVATDVSPGALQTAADNAKALGAAVEFIRHDILHEALPAHAYDVLVSNPPYIHPDEARDMQQQVLAHEPHGALFAPPKNPLVFYEAIALKASVALTAGGCVATEINAKFGEEVKNIFVEEGYKEVTLHQDINGKDRFITAIK